MVMAFPKKSQLEEYLLRIEEAKKRDHRRLGRELDLYSVNDEIGPGLILWHPKGGFIRYKIEEFWRQEHLKNGYEFVYTPHLARIDLWSTSGHLDFFKENMYSPMEVDEQQYLVKPMNCPFHLQIYQQPDPQLSRPADPVGRTGDRLSLRTLRRAAWPDARARFYPG